MASHTSRDFEVELRELRAHTLVMGARCERILQTAFEGYWNGVDKAIAEVEELDEKIDQDELEIDALVLRILALRQPVAYDLRFLATALKLVTDLERIGDEAVNISERIRRSAPSDRPPELLEMADRAREMLRGALEAFVQGDVEKAEKVVTGDDKVDDTYATIVTRLTRSLADTKLEPEQVERMLAMLQVAKYIERIADHATNIGEHVIFMVGGQDVRHMRRQKS